MNNKSNLDIEGLKEQLLSNPKFKPKDEQKENICKRLHEQLVEKEAVVKIQRMDAECFNLINNLQNRLLFIQDVLTPSENQNKNFKLVKKEYRVEDLFELNLSSDSSDDEILSDIIAKKKVESATESSKNVKVMETVIEEKNKKQQENEIDLPQDSEPICSSVEKNMRKPPRERRSSYKSFSSSSSSSKNVANNQFASKKQRCISHGKKETAVSTSGVVYHDDDDVIVVEDCVTPHTFHIKIPSLFKGQVHQLRLDSLEFGRKVFDYRARQAKEKCLQLKQQQQQLHCLKNPKNKKSQKKNEKLFTTSRHQDFLQKQDTQFSQLIEDLMNETGNEETLQATKALENINNNINDNYESISSLLPLSQSSHEISLSQNSRIGSNKHEESTKKPRKYSKRTNDQQPNEPAKKRGRKPKVKNISELDVSIQPQPPTKSNLAKYVEYFGNDCELLPPGSQTPAASSTMSQPLVSSTTQNFELIEHQQQQIQQQPITYFIDGDWANGGPCQLVQTTGIPIDPGQINQDALSVPFQDFVNYIDNNTTDTGNNVIARVLDNCTMPIANMGFQNIFQSRQLQQQTTQNLLNQPVINIQIPSLQLITNNIGSPPPPMAHLHEEGVLDLSVKSQESNGTINSYDVLNLNKKSNNILELSSTAIEEDNCLPLDLSIKNSSLYQNCSNASKESQEREESESQSSVVEIHDDDFIRRLIETNDFELRPQELTKDCSNTTTYDDGKSFKAALNMPLLEFDVQDLDQFVANSTAKITGIGVDENDQLDDIGIENDFTNCMSNNDSNYASMNESNSNILNSPFDNEIHFTDQSTKEIFDKLLDIHPTKNYCNLKIVGDKKNTLSYIDLDENNFVHNNEKNSTVYETENVTNKNSSKEAQTKCSINQQIVLNSADERPTNNITNDNKPAAVQKFIPRILKRRNSLFKKTSLLNCQEKSNNNAKIVTNLHKNLPKSVMQTETTNALTTDDCAKNLYEHLIVQNGKDIDQTTLLVEDLNVKESSDISSNLNISANDNLVIKSHTELEKDNMISMDKQEDFHAKVSSKILSNLNISLKETLIKIANENLIIKSHTDKQVSSNILSNMNTSIKETLHNSNNESLRENLKEVNKNSNISKNSLEQIPTPEANDQNLEQSLNILENQNSNNLTKEFPTDILNGVETIEIDKKQSCTEVENLHLKQLSDSSINFKVEIVSLNDPINPKRPLENSNNSYKSIQLNSPEKSIISSKSLYLENSESDSLKKLNKSIKIKSSESEESLNLVMCDSDSLEKSNNSIQINSEKSTETVVSKQSDEPLASEMTESDSLEKSNSTNESIQINSPKKFTESNDVAFNLEIPDTDHSKNLKVDSTKTTLDNAKVLNDISEPEENSILEQSQPSNKYTQNDTPHENIANKTLVDFNTTYSNEKVVFSIAKITLSDDDALLTDSDTLSRKSYDDVPTHHDNELKIENSNMEVQSNYMENILPQSMESQIDCSEHEQFNYMPQTKNKSFIDDAESENDTLCLTTEIQKKYVETCISDVIDLSVKCATDMEDNLIIELDETQSPKVPNNHSTKFENRENPTTNKETLPEMKNKKLTNDKINTANIVDSVENIFEENKHQTSKFCSLKASDISHLTPLELDSKLDETLDFEEDFDDALSLATSCFDSPNDDRFEESVLDESEQQTSIAQINNDTTCIDNKVTEQTSTVSTLQTPQNSQPSSNGLRNFKIPKITKSSTTEENVDLQTKSSSSTSSSLKTNISSIPNVTMKQAIVKLENITRTVKNELAATGSVNVIQLQQQQPAILTHSLAKQHIKHNFTDKTEHLPFSVIDPQNSQALPISDNLTNLFGITCQSYLVNKCYAITHCPLSHQLNDPDSVFQALSSLNRFDLNEAYRYIYNHSNMFKIFFIVFCNLFTLRKDRAKLLNMVHDVERYPEYSQFIIAIYEAIVKCGLNRVNACRQILKRSRVRTTFNIDALVAIIMKSDWTMFTDYIEQYTEEIYKYNFCIGVLEQMVPAVLNCKGPQLKQVFGKCVQTLRCEDTGLLLNSPSLIQCVALLTSTT